MISNTSDNSGIILFFVFCIFIAVKGWNPTWAATFMITQTKERQVHNAVQHEMLLCRVRLWSRATFDAISSDEPFQKKKTDKEVYLIMVSENKQHVFKNPEDTWAHPGSNKLMSRPWYECMIIQGSCSVKAHTPEQTYVVWPHLLLFKALRGMLGYWWANRTSVRKGS